MISKTCNIILLFTIAINCTQHHGFFPGRSTCTQLLESQNELCSAMDNNIFSDVILIDFSKAYDIATYIGLDWCLSERQVSIY